MSFSVRLHTQNRWKEIPEAHDVYGWLIGSWDIDVWYHVRGGEQSKGEVHFGRVLEGRAVQDVWIAPPYTYGTTLRVWDPSIEAWRVTWINPVSGKRDELIGRRIGDELVQIGTHQDGTPIRWKFTEIAPDSFRWTGEALQADGSSWKLEAEFRGRRRKE
jgi:hypothetical protein